MAPTRQAPEAPERETGIPATVRCRPDPDGVVVWVPTDDEPEPEPESGVETQADQG
jgi:hypothetical protein